MFDATQQDVSCGGGVGWGGYDDVHLHLHTCLMLRNRMFHVGVGWGGVGMMTFICTCTHVQTCDNFRCQSASRWTASVHTSHMSKPVITLVFKVPSNGLLNSIKLAQTQSFLRDPYFWTRAHILDITLFYVRVEIAKLQRRLCVMSILVQKSQIPHAPKKGCQNFSKHRC